MGRQLARQGAFAVEEAALAALGEGGRQLAQVRGAERQIDEREALEERFALDLRQAAGHDHDAAGVEGLDAGGLAEMAREAVVGARPHGAGVVDDDVGVVDAGHPHKAVAFEQSADALGIVVVHLTAERP